tara:strand:- start:2554 stop:2745 length:192 start_codon:yes stop_codon:yes gene_type:complete
MKYQDDGNKLKVEIVESGMLSGFYYFADAKEGFRILLNGFVMYFQTKEEIEKFSNELGFTLVE